jgi:hypothetical protein
MKYSLESKSLFEVFFPVNKNIFLYGKKPKIFGSITTENSENRELELWKEQTINGEFEKMQNEEEDNYLVIPFFKFNTPEQAVKSEQLKELDNSIKKAHIKQNMVYIGKLLHDMYKGLEYKMENGFNPIDGGFNPNILKFGNNTDIFLSLHRNEKTQKLRKFWEDKYFGYKKTFIDNLKNYIKGSLINPGQIKEMDSDLDKSFAGFISKLANYDDENKNQFDGYESALKHEFIAVKIGHKKIRSDTSYDI